MSRIQERRITSTERSIDMPGGNTFNAGADTRVESVDDLINEGIMISPTVVSATWGPDAAERYTAYVAKTVGARVRAQQQEDARNSSVAALKPIDVFVAGNI